MDDVLGLLLLGVYIVGIVGLAAAITYAVVRIFPTERNPKKKSDSGDKPDNAGSSAASSSEGQGRLFRRSKREST